MIQFLSPSYLWLGAGLAIFLLLLNIFTFKRVRFFRRRDLLRASMWSVAVLFLGAALAEAKLEWKQPLPVMEKLEIIFGIDVSLSALAKDAIVFQEENQQIVSRLDFEKVQVEKIVASLGDDAIGIIAFAADAIPLQIVLSREDRRNTILRNLKRIDKIFVRYEIPQGTDYGILFLTALEQFSKTNEAKKILFVLTDGEQQGDEGKLKENLEKAVNALSERNDITIYFIAVGDDSKTSLIPKIEDENGNPKEYYTYEEGEMAGQPISTRPHQEFLAQLANGIDGHYLQANDDETLNALLQDAIKQERRIIGFEEKTRIINLAPYLLIGALICLFTIPLIKSV